MVKDKLDRLTEGLLEKQALRLLCFILAGYCILSSVQLMIGYTVLNFNSWISVTLDSSYIGYTVSLFPLFAGLILLVGKIKRKRKLVLNGLFLIWVFHLTMALLNAVAYSFQGTPMLPYLFVGLCAAVLYSYYRQLDDNEVAHGRELL